jgi:hypothetical protein
VLRIAPELDRSSSREGATGDNLEHDRRALEAIEQRLAGDLGLGSGYGGQSGGHPRPPGHTGGQGGLDRSGGSIGSPPRDTPGPSSAKSLALAEYRALSAGVPYRSSLLGREVQPAALAADGVVALDYARRPAARALAWLRLAWPVAVDQLELTLAFARACVAVDRAGEDAAPRWPELVTLLAQLETPAPGPTFEQMLWLLERHALLDRSTATTFARPADQERLRAVVVGWQRLEATCLQGASDASELLRLASEPTTTQVAWLPASRPWSLGSMAAGMLDACVAEPHGDPQRLLMSQRGALVTWLRRDERLAAAVQPGSLSTGTLSIEQRPAAFAALALGLEQARRSWTWQPDEAARLDTASAWCREVSRWAAADRPAPPDLLARLLASSSAREDVAVEAFPFQAPSLEVEGWRSLLSVDDAGRLHAGPVWAVRESPAMAGATPRDLIWRTACRSAAPR